MMKTKIIRVLCNMFVNFVQKSTNFMTQTGNTSWRQKAILAAVTNLQNPWFSLFLILGKVRN